MLLKKIDLGPLDAENDQNLKKYFISQPDYENISNRKTFLIIGPKGSGKTAIKKYFLETSDGEKNLIQEVSQKSGFPLDTLNTRKSIEIRQKMYGFLTALILHTLITRELLTEVEKSELESLTGDKPSFIRNLLNATTFSLGEVVKISVKELFPEDKKENLCWMINPKLKEFINGLMQDKKVWILIDDVDVVFEGENKEDIQSFLGGLIISVKDINLDDFSPSIWVNLFLRSEIYEELRRNIPDLDKVCQYEWNISWNKSNLRQFLVTRLRWVLGVDKSQEDWKVISQLFEVSNKDDAESILDYIITRSINGPRDILMFIDGARKEAIRQRHTLIARDDLCKNEYEYGHNKILQLNANNKLSYPDLDLVIDRLFRNGKSTYSGVELESLIETNILTDPKSFSGHQWLLTRTRYGLLEILYKVGVIGVLDESKNRYVFSLEKENLSRRLTEYNLSVHNAFHVYLNLHNT